MIRVITNIKDDKSVSMTIPDHMKHGYSWAGYKKCGWCHVLISPLAVRALIMIATRPRIIHCANCGSLFNTVNVSNTYAAL